VAKNLAIIPYGLYTSDQTCELWQIQKVNLGDTHSICDGNAGEERRRMTKEGYKKVGTMQTTTLDGLVSSGKMNFGAAGSTVVKIDVEGYEPFALGGGKKVLAKSPPRAVQSEFTVQMLNGHEGEPDLAKKYITMMQGFGYSLFTVAGDQIPDDSISKMKIPGNVVFRLHDKLQAQTSSVRRR
jgi:hypothetical protein